VKDNSVFFEFHFYKYLVKSHRTKKVLLHGVVVADGLYSFNNVQLFNQYSQLQSLLSSLHILLNLPL